jgi:rRNA-processing protein FCF1
MITSQATKQPMRVLIDTNALFVPLQFKIDIFAELERLLGKNFVPILLSPVKKELQTLSKQSSPKIRKDTTFALGLAKKCKYVRIRIKNKRVH